jgi:hypothetical protein
MCRCLALLALMLALSCAAAAPIAVAGGAMPSQAFLFGMCDMEPADGPQQQPPPNSMWPMRVNDICASLGFNDPARAKDTCDMMEGIKMLLASPGFTPLRCQPDSLPPPPSADTRGAWGVLQL